MERLVLSVSLGFLQWEYRPVFLGHNQQKHGKQKKVLNYWIKPACSPQCGEANILTWGWQSKVPNLLQALNKEEGQPVTQKGKISRWLLGKDFRRQSEGECLGSSSWAIFWLVGDVIGSQLHQPSSSNWSMVCLVLVSMLLTSSTWWEFQCLQTAQEHGSDIICSPWRGFQDPWIWLMAKLLLLSVACFPLFPHFLIFSVYIYSLELEEDLEA